MVCICLSSLSMKSYYMFGQIACNSNQLFKFYPFQATIYFRNQINAYFSFWIYLQVGPPPPPPHMINLIMQYITSIRYVSICFNTSKQRLDDFMALNKPWISLDNRINRICFILEGSTDQSFSISIGSRMSVDTPYSLTSTSSGIHFAAWTYRRYSP